MGKKTGWECRGRGGGGGTVGRRVGPPVSSSLKYCETCIVNPLLTDVLRFCLTRWSVLFQIALWDCFLDVIAFSTGFFEAASSTFKIRPRQQSHSATGHKVRFPFTQKFRKFRLGC